MHGGPAAEAAGRRVQDDMRARMRQIRDLYIRERRHDLDDLSNRLLQHLAAGDANAAPSPEMPADAILFARSMGPAELLDYPREHVRAVVLEEGTPTAHVAVVARALDIPMIGAVEDGLSAVQPGDPVIVDGNHGQVFVRPGDDVQQVFIENMRAREEQRARYAALRDEPAVSLDGIELTLHINAGLQIDAEHVASTGAAGLGLYRPEVPFIVRDRFPDATDQTEPHRRILAFANERPVGVRTPEQTDARRAGESGCR